MTVEYCGHYLVRSKPRWARLTVSRYELHSVWCGHSVCFFVVVFWLDSSCGLLFFSRFSYLELFETILVKVSGEYVSETFT